MNVWLGDAFIVVTLVMAIVVMATAAQGIVRGSAPTIGLAIRLTWVVFAAAILAFAILERALITRDFSVAYVAKNGSTLTPPLFNFAAAWASLEGSILLWGVVLAGYLAIVSWRFRERTNDPIVGWAVLVMAGVTAYFFVLLAGPADPFVAISPVPADGKGPNPLLQNNVLMAFHPPMLYLGYVGFTVPFAFAAGALATGRFDEGWLVATRRWSLFAWGFLTVGIMLGSWWAYDVLGWGGYWGWDPVENASLLPWLTATAYIHSVLVQERRGILRVWNLSLVCATFALTILGTFITRSGILVSVHEFSESDIGPWLVAFLGLIIAAAVGLIGWRAEALRSPGGIDNPVSREASFLVNNLVFAVFAFVVLLGTIFPLAAEAYDGRRLSVGTPYFDRMTAPLGLTLLFLMAVAPVLPWRKTTASTLADRLRWPVWLGVASLVVAVALGGRGFMPLVAFFLAGFAAGSALRQLVLATRRNGWRGLVGRANGGMIVHLGVIAVAVGIAGSSAYLRQAELAFDKGQTIEFADSTFTYRDMETTLFANRRELAALVTVDGTELRPAVEQYLATGQQVASPATRSSLASDLQLSITQLPEDPGDPVVLKLTSQPLVAWLWLGGAIMAAGTILAAFPGRFTRRPTEPVSAPTRSAVEATT